MVNAIDGGRHVRDTNEHFVRAGQLLRELDDALAERKSMDVLSDAAEIRSFIVAAAEKWMPYEVVNEHRVGYAKRMREMIMPVRFAAEMRRRIQDLKTETPQQVQGN